MLRGRPLMMMSIVGLPDSLMRFMSSFCNPTRSRLSLSVSSPLVRSFHRNRIMYSPQQTIFRSASFAFSTASSTLACDILRGSHPWSTNSNSVLGATCLSPFNTVDTLSSGCTSLQSPMIFWSLALIPVTSTFLYLLASRGNNEPSFLRSTIELRVASRAVALCSGELIT